MLSPDDNILAVGSCLAGLGVLVTGLLALLFRRPDAPRWTRRELVAMLVSVPVTGMIGFGLGYAAYGVSRLVDGTGDPGDLLVLAGVLVVLALAWRALAFRRRLKDYAAASGGSSPQVYQAPERPVAVDETAAPRPGPGTVPGRAG